MIQRNGSYKLTRAIGRYRPGTVGTIVRIDRDNDAYELETVAPAGLVTVSADDIEPILLHAGEDDYEDDYEDDQ